MLCKRVVGEQFSVFLSQVLPHVSVRCLLWAWLLCGSLAVAAATTGAPLSHEPIHPIPAPPVLDAAKVALGEKLFNDPILSREGVFSCASCHHLAYNGADAGLKKSLTRQGEVGLLNVPTVFNASLSHYLGWRGNLPTLAAQIDSVVLNSQEFDTHWLTIIGKLNKDPNYPELFQGAYADKVISKPNILNALNVFEETLVTPNSRFDQYLKGDAKAISLEEKQGYALFKSHGCIACHQGVNVGGNMYQKIGVIMDYFEHRGGPVTEVDMGRFTFTGDNEDRFVFRVPSLRNVAVTPPYFHDGSAATLEDAVKVMMRVQLGDVDKNTHSQMHLSKIIAFLNTLTGQYQGQWLKTE